MKLKAAISSVISKWFGKETESKSEVFIASVIKTRAFSKLSLQDKMLSVGRLITLFRSDNGYIPESLERAMEKLNLQVRRESVKTWQTLYSNPESKTR